MHFADGKRVSGSLLSFVVVYSVLVGWRPVRGNRRDKNTGRCIGMTVNKVSFYYFKTIRTGVMWQLPCS